MIYLQGTAIVIGILFMLTFMFIGIWLFIVALKTYNQICYKNYILEKIYQRLSFSNLSSKDDCEEDIIESLDELFEK